MLNCGRLRRSFFALSASDVDVVVNDSVVLGWNNLEILDAVLRFALLTNVNAIIVSLNATNSKTLDILYIFLLLLCNVIYRLLYRFSS